MHKKFIGMIGQKFGRLTVIRQVKSDKYGRSCWLCKCDCGNEKIIGGTNLRNGNSKSCGCLANELAAQRGRKNVGPNSPNWKGGKYIDRNGYIRIYIGRNEYRFEHILIMEQHLDRKLLKNETVHHKNGIKDDNRIENLELWSCDHPSGQKVEDKIIFAIEILKRYAPDNLQQIIKDGRS